MSTPVKQRRLPNHAVLDDDSLETYAQLTRDGIYNLMPKELFWQARHKFLKDHGYLLRPRYTPGWKPSWTGTNLDPTFCEDSILLIDHQVMDATRLSNHETVAIKSFHKQGEELHIAQFFTAIRDPNNHCVPVHEIFTDPFEPHLALMVMPYLRPCNDPEFATVGDVIEFVDQTVNGLEFMHRYNVAHRDVTAANVMMDARSIYPAGHHPVHIAFSRDVLYPVSPLPRAGRNVRYFYIDFGLSSYFPEGSSSLVVGDYGRNADVPELSDTVPYDAFKLDIFSLGCVYSEEFEQKYKGMEFLLSLIESMTQRQPEQRPTAEQVRRDWEKTRATINESLLRWRLSPKNEPALERVVNDTVAVAWEGVYRLKKFVRQ